MSHDIIPKHIWEGDFDTFKKFLKSLRLQHPLCKDLLFEYAKYHDIKIRYQDVLDTCPEESTTNGQ